MASMAANSDQQTQQPTCQNCQTSTTPLWRRDESGAVLCNACGLFLKLHGRPRPISLKTDVIKSRNRVKTMRPGMEMKKKVRAQEGTLAGHFEDPKSFEANSLHWDQNLPVAPDGNVADIQAQNAAAAALNASVRRPTQRPGNGHIDDANSPIPRTTTPNMYTNHMLYHGLDDHHMQQPLGGLGLGAPGNGHAHSPLNGEAVPQTQEELVALNSGLKTRVDELEVINDLIQRRLQHYEVYGAGQPAAGLVEGGHDAEVQLRAQVDTLTASESQLRSQLDESHRRENNLKRRLDEMELELKDAKESLEAYENGRAKRPRLEEPDHFGSEIKQDILPEAALEAPLETAVEASVEAPVDAPSEAPAEAPVEAPVEAPAEAPAEVPAEVPVETSIDAPVEAAVEATGEAPTDANVEAPAEAPAEISVAEAQEDAPMMEDSLQVTA